MHACPLARTLRMVPGWGRVSEDELSACIAQGHGQALHLRVLRLGWGEWHYDAVILTWPQEGRRS